ncbi:MAG: ABC transporter substrate-binding protein, partial [Bacteroidota bacterium]|nr:ABC transporter substrate-binding protein [Bacteroidota bacterium]
HSAIVLLLFLHVSILEAQETIPYHAAAEETFENALQDYRAESYRSAATQFLEVIRNFPLNQRTTASYIMAARAQLFSDTPQRGLRLLEEFRDQYPGSEYVAESWLVSGDGSLAANSAARAIVCYLRAWEAGHPDTTLLESRLRSLDRPRLSAYDTRIIRGYLSLLPSEQRLAAVIGLEETARVKAAAARENDVAERRKQTTIASTDRKSLPSIIAVALPQHASGPVKERIVDELKRGMQAAWQLHEDSLRGRVVLEYYDSADEAALPGIVARLEANPRVLALLAGAFSDDARRVCALAGERDLPVLLPTATDDSLTLYGSNIFQLNTPMEERARLLADFASLELDASAAAVLAPDDSWPRRMADAFIARASQLGLPVTDAVYYDPQAGNIAAACRRLKKSGGAKNRILFAPVRSRGDIAHVLQGAKHSGCTATILGAGNWNHPDLLTDYGSDLTVYYESDVAPDSSCGRIRALRRELGLRSSKGISAEVLFGYDAMQLALALVGDGTVTRPEARRRLRSIHEGLRAPVDFRQSRVNSALNVLRYRHGRVRQLESFHAK